MAVATKDRAEQQHTTSSAGHVHPGLSKLRTAPHQTHTRAQPVADVLAEPCRHLRAPGKTTGTTRKDGDPQASCPTSNGVVPPLRRGQHGVWSQVLCRLNPALSLLMTPRALPAPHGTAGPLCQDSLDLGQTRARGKGGLG